MADEKTGSGEGRDAIVPVVDARTRSMIHTVRGRQVMLDSDLAELYGVETKALNRAASRNSARFPEDFRFKLGHDEFESLRCQIGTSNNGDGRGGRRYMPYAYTEQGVSMLSAVLRSEAAVRVSVQIMRAFVEMRHFIADNAHMFEQVRDVERRQIEYQQKADERFERVFDYMESHVAPRQKVFFEGQVWDAFELLVSLVQRAKKSVLLVDGYTDAGTFNTQYPMLTVLRIDAFHDRLIILDGAEAYLVGASLKDAGKKAFGITRIEDAETVQAILARLGRAREDGMQE